MPAPLALLDVLAQIPDPRDPALIVHDRNAELQHLQDRKQNLEKQMDDLTDEGRKAGADPGWFR